MVDTHTYNRIHGRGRNSTTYVGGCSVSDTKTYDSWPLAPKITDTVDVTTLRMLPASIRAFEMQAKRWGRRPSFILP
jgi:hypothetical protein